MKRKGMFAVIFLVSFILFSILIFQQWDTMQKSWNDMSTWGLANVTYSKEGEKLINITRQRNSYFAEVSSCSLYKSELRSNGDVMLFCSLYPSRYFSAIPWLSSSATELTDYVITLPQNKIKVNYNGSDVVAEDTTKYFNSPKQVKITLEGTEKSSSIHIVNLVKHFIKTKSGKIDTNNGEIKRITILEKPSILKKDYLNQLFSTELIKRLKAEQGRQRVETFINTFKNDSSNEDSTPHFTEGLVYGLYLLGESEPDLSDSILKDLGTFVVPFRSPSLVEQEIQPSGSITLENVISAPHTKFPLCPIKEVSTRKWDSIAIKVFMSYQKYQPEALGTLNPEKLLGIYDEKGNLLLYNDMVGVDAMCQKLIEKKDTSQLPELMLLYQRFVNQYFVYSEGDSLGDSVIEGSDSLRGVVLRGIAKDPNIARRTLSLDNIKRSLFDGILWEYVYGK